MAFGQNETERVTGLIRQYRGAPGGASLPLPGGGQEERRRGRVCHGRSALLARPQHWAGTGAVEWHLQVAFRSDVGSCVEKSEHILREHSRSPLASRASMT